MMKFTSIFSGVEISVTALMESNATCQLRVSVNMYAVNIRQETMKEYRAGSRGGFNN